MTSAATHFLVWGCHKPPISGQRVRAGGRSFQVLQLCRCLEACVMVSLLGQWAACDIMAMMSHNAPGCLYTHFGNCCCKESAAPYCRWECWCWAAVTCPRAPTEFMAEARYTLGNPPIHSSIFDTSLGKDHFGPPQWACRFTAQSHSAVQRQWTFVSYPGLGAPIDIQLPG